MRSVRIAQYADLAGRAALIVFFTYVMVMNGLGIVGMFHLEGGPNPLELASRLASLAFVVLIVGLTIFRLKPVKSAEGLEPRISALLGTGLSIGMSMLPRVDLDVSLQIVSLVLNLVGWMLSAYVLLWLGRAFSVMAQARRLVTSGPYAIVRHPLYLSEEIAVIGIALNHISIEAAVVLAVQWLFQLRRMANEEKVLRAAFPEYDAYANRTPKVIPRFFPKLKLGHA